MHWIAELAGSGRGQVETSFVSRPKNSPVPQLAILRRGRGSLSDDKHARTALEMHVLAGRGDHGTPRIVRGFRAQTETVQAEHTATV